MDNYTLEKVREIVAITRESTYLEGRLKIFQGDESPPITLDEIVPLRDRIKSLLSKMVEFPEVFSQNIQSYSQLVSLVDEETEGYLNRIQEGVRNRDYVQDEFKYSPREEKKDEENDPKDKLLVEDDLPF